MAALHDAAWGTILGYGSGLLTLGFAITVILFIRVGEKLSKVCAKTTIWGALIICAAIILQCKHR